MPKEKQMNLLLSGKHKKCPGRHYRLHSIFVLLCAMFCFCAIPAGADTFTFKADKMSGSKALGREVTILQGNAEVRSDNLILKAERIEIQGDDNQFIDCTGGVWGMEEEKEIFFQTDRLRYDRTLKIARLEGNSTLEDKKNEIVARGRFIEYDDNAEVTVFQISVRLFKDDMVCRSEYAVYRRTEKLLDLSGFPVVFKKDDEFRADRIRVDLDTDDVTMEGSVSGTIKN
jgi:lipopolysaccharide export system protein LptA